METETCYLNLEACADRARGYTLPLVDALEASGIDIPAAAADIADVRYGGCDRLRIACRRYNGWSNRATWCVALWLGNDEYSAAAAAQLCADGPRPDAIRALILGQIDEVIPSGGLISDLIGGLVDIVDWLEVAEAFAPSADDVAAAHL